MTIAPEITSLRTTDEFNYRDCWYPVVFRQDLTQNPYSFSLYDEPLVLFQDDSGNLGCLVDRCPHRRAKLSEGQRIEGRLECLYHGWQFDTLGRCVRIPQLADDTPIPRNARVTSYTVVERQGMIWVWLGEKELANEEEIPIIADLELSNCVHTDYLIDFPYEHGYLLENLLDPAHVSISHDRSEFGAKRENAQPLAMEVLEVSARGIQSRWRETRNPNASWKSLNFIAPNLVHYRFSLPNPDWVAGLALYGISLGKGRSRLLVRRYQNFATNSRAYRWRWLEHLRQNRILEDDLPLIVSQQESTEKSSDRLQNLYLPLKTSDLLVIEYRQWLDCYGESLPYYRGYRTGKESDLNSIEPLAHSRYTRHTVNCSTCRSVHEKMSQLKKIAIGTIITLTFLAILSQDQSIYQFIFVFLALLAVGVAITAHYTKTKFEQTYKKVKSKKAEMSTS